MTCGSHLHTPLLQVFQASVASLKGLNRLKNISSCAITSAFRRENKTFRMWWQEWFCFCSCYGMLSKYNHQHLCSKANGNKHQHRHTQVGGLTSYPHLTGKGGVRLYGRELSSPTGPWGRAALKQNGILFFFFVMFPVFFSPLLCFVLFRCVHTESVQRHDEQTGSFSHVDLISWLVTTPFICPPPPSPHHVSVSSCLNTEEFSGVLCSC